MKNRCSNREPYILVKWYGPSAMYTYVHVCTRMYVWVWRMAYDDDDIYVSGVFFLYLFSFPFPVVELEYGYPIRRISIYIYIYLYKQKKHARGGYTRNTYNASTVVLYMYLLVIYQTPLPTHPLLYYHHPNPPPPPPPPLPPPSCRQAGGGRLGLLQKRGDKFISLYTLIVFLFKGDVWQKLCQNKTHR